MCTTNRLDAGFRKPKVFDLACLNQVLYRSRGVLDWYGRVNTVL